MVERRTNDGIAPKFTLGLNKIRFSSPFGPGFMKEAPVTLNYKLLFAYDFDVSLCFCLTFN